MGPTIANKPVHFVLFTDTVVSCYLSETIETLNVTSNSSLGVKLLGHLRDAPLGLSLRSATGCAYSQEPITQRKQLLY